MEIIGVDPGLEMGAAMPKEPEIDYCTLRDSVDEYGHEVIDVECRFKDGQKFAPIQIDGEFPELAEKIMRFLNGE